MKYKGKGVSHGVGFGILRINDKIERKIIKRTIDDIDQETALFRTAQKKAIAQLADLSAGTEKSLGKENSMLFEIHRMMLEDLDYNESILKIIRNEKACAEHAVSETAKEFSDMFSNMDDEYMKGRAIDVMDISQRVINILTDCPADKFESNGPVILFAKDFTPSETAQLDRTLVKALLSIRGSDNSHTAIFARTLGIPAIIELSDADLYEMDGKYVAVDGETGSIYIEPTGSILEQLKDKQRHYENEKQSENEYIGKPTMTSSGRRIKLYANIGSVDDAAYALKYDADGIGLFRSEFLFLERNEYPSEDEQFLAYKSVAEKMEGKEVIIRTLDAGADKQIPYLNLPFEENPALGLRAIRICLAKPDIFKTQLRVILRASAFGKISIMFPMIVSVSEIHAAKAILELAHKELDEENISYDHNISVGIMIETPASAMISDDLAKEVDFFSIGTNDLTQYTLAMDRQNSNLTSNLDTHHKAIMRLIKTTIDNAHEAGIWVGICGELAYDRDLTKVFIDMGIDELSVSPFTLLSLRKHIAEI